MSISVEKWPRKQLRDSTIPVPAAPVVPTPVAPTPVPEPTPPPLSVASPDTTSDFKGKENDPFVCLNFQKEIERKCWELAGRNQQVPAQCLLDFVQKKKSQGFPRSSYQPGIVSIEMDKIFPEFITERLRQAFVDFGRKMHGFVTNDAVLHAPESRTSSPILIPRNNENLQHEEISNLYPSAEGAGYAGGIVSAAIDGMKCVEAIYVLKAES